MKQEEALTSARKISHLYSMDLENLAYAIIDFERSIKSLSIGPSSSGLFKYRRGYLIRKDEEYVREKEMINRYRV